MRREKTKPGLQNTIRQTLFIKKIPRRKGGPRPPPKSANALTAWCSGKLSSFYESEYDDDLEMLSNVTVQSISDAKELSTLLNQSTIGLLTT